MVKPGHENGIGLNFVTAKNKLLFNLAVEKTYGRSVEFGKSRDIRFNVSLGQA